jgi:GNAT superfamily N-acetyltransferase
MARPPAADLRIVPANAARWEDIQAVFGTRGSAAICQCQRYKLAAGEAFSKFPVEERAARLREQTFASTGETTGLVAYLDGEPVGWCGVQPRTAYPGLLRVYRTPWEGRTEDRSDPGVWAVTCFAVRAGSRRRGIAYALARAAVDHARARGARALEGYPMITRPGQDIAWDEIHVGNRRMFEAAGFRQVHQPSLRRVVMRIDFAGDVERQAAGSTSG